MRLTLVNREIRQAGLPSLRHDVARQDALSVLVRQVTNTRAGVVADGAFQQRAGLLVDERRERPVRSQIVSNLDGEW